MGADEWAYFVPYEPEITKALHKLRQREFQAGRYYPATSDVEFLPGPDSPGPGAQHATIEEAIEAAAENGTGSILDIHRVGEEPEDFEDGVVVPLAEETIQEVFGTSLPTREMILRNRSFLQDCGRGQGVFVVVFRDGKPSEIFFDGLSYD